MDTLSALCSDCRRLRDGVRSLAHEYLLETDSLGQTYMCLICDTHLICQRKGNATFWMVTPDLDAEVPQTGSSRPRASRTDSRPHR
jgi:hypothetical protein